MYYEPAGSWPKKPAIEMAQIIRISAIAATIVFGLICIYTAMNPAANISVPWYAVLGAGVVMVANGVARIYRN